MKTSIPDYLSLSAWIVSIVCIGSIIGSLTKFEIQTWYNTLNQSPLTPPNYVFPIVWTILYTMLAVCGWIIWRTPAFLQKNLIKILYIIHLMLNWSWTPLFFGYGFTGLALIVLISMDIIISIIIYLTYRKIPPILWLMTPYLLWILFATYLNFYIWQNN